MKHNKIFIYGKHAVVEALMHAPQSVSRVFLASHVQDPELTQALKKADIQPRELGSDKKTRSTEDGQKHQGIIAQVSLTSLVKPYKEFIHDVKVTPKTAFLLLSEIQDPHNVGAVIRSAAAFGFSGVLIPERKQAPITGAVVKVSAGMAFRIPLISIGNINMVVEDLKKKGFWIYGLDGSGKTSVSDETFDHPSVFILGNEASGMREKTREACDVLLKIPIHNRCESLNAAASAAIAMYAWSRQHPDAL